MPRRAGDFFCVSANVHLPIFLRQFAENTFAATLLFSTGIWRIFELVIRELKESYATGKIPTKFFKANLAFFQPTVFAYNLLNWFRLLCLPKEYKRMTLQTIRSKLIAIPAELVFPQNKPKTKSGPD